MQNKIFISGFLISALFVSGAMAAPTALTRTANGGYNVSYNYNDKPKTEWYGTIRAELNLLSWTNKYYTASVGSNQYDSDKYSMKPLFGGSLAVGKKFEGNWRGEIEAGYTGQFTDKDDGFEFNLSAPYALANAFYDFEQGGYLGAGLGLAMPTTTLDSDVWVSGIGARQKTTVSPMAGLMAGYAFKLDDNFVLDLRYRIAGFNGTKHTRAVEYTDGTIDEFQNKIGLILENSFSLGLRYEF